MLEAPLNRRSSSRLYNVSIGGVTLTPYELQLLRSEAITLYKDEGGADPSRAWVSAVLNLLVARGILPATENKKSGETI